MTRERKLEVNAIGFKYKERVMFNVSMLQCSACTNHKEGEKENPRKLVT